MTATLLAALLFLTSLDSFQKPMQHTQKTEIGYRNATEYNYK